MKKGFTLIELLVTISIIAILMVIAMAVYAPFQKTGRDAKRKSDLAVMQSALEQYHADRGYYPSAVIFDGDHSLSSDTKTYLAKIPADSSYSYIALPNSPSSCTNCTGYSLCAKMENPVNASPSLTNCTAPASNYEVRPP